MWCWRRRRRRDEASGAPVLSPLEELQRTLVDLGPRIGREPAEVVCDRLASAVRRFLERRSGEPAAEMTSHELQVLARRSGWPEDVQTALLRVMRTADGARFGRIPAGETELSGARDLALQLGNRLESFFAPDETAEEEVA